MLFLAVVLGLLTVNPILGLALYFGGAWLYYRSPSVEPGTDGAWEEGDSEEELFLWEEEML